MHARRIRRPSRFARRLIALSVVACAALAVPALGQANSTVTFNGVSLVYRGEDAVNNAARVVLNAAGDKYTVTDSENITTASITCTGSGTQTVTCTTSNSAGNAIDLDGLNGNDTITVDTSAASVDNQPGFVSVGNSGPEGGNDHIDLSKFTNPEGQSRIVGGPGDDVETAAPGGTDFEMGTDPDGADQLIGGPGFDQAGYNARTGSLTLSAADGLANDGEAGEHDNISSNIEKLDGGSGNDNITAGLVDSDLLGNDGNDTLTGGPGGDQISGGSGTNRLSGGPGDDSFGARDGTANTMDGGPGDDEFELGTGTDDVHGGDGFDFVDVFEEGPAPDFAILDVSVTLDDVANDGASGEFKNIHSDIEDISTGPGNDTVVGTNAAEQIFTESGNDLVSAGGGSDQVFTSTGDDAVSARDGLFDRISCGGGTDSATVDDIDSLSGCENVSSAAVPVPAVPHDTQPAQLSITRLAKRMGRAKFLKNGLSARVAPSEPVRLIFTLTGHLHGSRIARAGDVVVATRTLGTSGSARTVKLGPAKSLKRKFARRFKLRLEVLAVDGGGNVTNARRTISVR